MHNGPRHTTFVMQHPDLKPEIEDAYYLHHTDCLTALVMRAGQSRGPRLFASFRNNASGGDVVTGGA